LISRAAAGLRKLGVKAGDRAALVLPNCPQHIIAFHAVLRLGAIVVEHNPLYTDRELRHQFEDHGATVAMVWDKAVQRVSQLPAGKHKNASEQPGSIRAPARRIEEETPPPRAPGPRGPPVHERHHRSAKGAMLTHANLQANAAQAGTTNAERGVADSNVIPEAVPVLTALIAATSNL
jgi:acyl-CoA synthetase (AMP-forming)/AMP-acid ligase II